MGKGCGADEALCQRKYASYHMSKAHWLSLALDGSVEDETLKFPLDRNCELTK